MTKPRGQRSRLPWILGGVGALVLIGGVILLILLLGDGGDGGNKGSTPQETAEAFAKAFNDRDTEGIKNLLCQTDLDAMAKSKKDPQATEYLNLPESAEITIVGATTEGDIALAHYTATGVKLNAPKFIPLVKSGDVWGVCFSHGFAG
jgi:hypothetical protein